MKKSHHFSERGQEALEFALTLPLLWLLLMGILDLGRVTYYKSALYSAAREGARYGIIFPNDGAGIEAVVRNKAVGLDLEPGSVATVLLNLDDDNSDAEAVQVSVTYPFTAITPIIAPLLGAGEITLHARATMRIER